jgi:hypothetical protein
VALVVPTTAVAGTVTLVDWTLADSSDFASNASGGGGPFKATTSLDSPLGVSTFLTFCLEFSELFRLNREYNYSLSDRAHAGGLRGAEMQNGISLGDPLSDETRWLYYMARFDHQSVITDLGGNLARSGKYFQEAIWLHEGERLESEILGLSLALANRANQEVANGAWTDLFNAGHRVYAMNLVRSDEQFVQDQLAHVKLTTTTTIPVSEADTLTYVLFALGVGLLALTRTRLQ